MKSSFELTTPPISVLEEPDFKKFIEFRKIVPEDLELIEQFSKLPKRLFLDFHNYFNSVEESPVKSFETDLAYAQGRLAKAKLDNDSRFLELTENRVKFLELYLAFAKKYDTATCMNLNAIFERRGR